MLDVSVNMEMNVDFNLKRRRIIKAGMANLIAATAGCALNNTNKQKAVLNINKVKLEQKSVIESVPEHLTFKPDYLGHDIAVRDSLQKIKHFDNVYVNDVNLIQEKQAVFSSTLGRILRVKTVVGYANFNLLSFDNMLIYANKFPQIGCFTKTELDFVEEIFAYNVNELGFYGKKVIQNLTSKINKKETIKIPGSGHYLFQGDALNKYKQLKKDLGSEIILTSGVRSIVKQVQLFFSKLETSSGNLSLTSRSLAPPGHSYHGIGDFDIGKKGYGKRNFTAEFANTREYKKLIKLNYIDLRYTQDNKVGVRYEPWHIKVV